jgi:hypothetical protein
LDSTILPQTVSCTPTITSSSSQENSPFGEASKSLDSEKQGIPKAEVLLEGLPREVTPRVLKVTSEDLYQWRQILGQYKKQMNQTLVASIQSKIKSN